MQAFTATISDADPANFMPTMPPSNMIYRIRECIAAEYVSGANISRAFWGLFLTWSADLRGAPAALLDAGAIGFLWRQNGAGNTNWRAIAAAHDGTNLFDKDTGKVANLIPYNMRVDIDGRVGQRNIRYYLDEVEVAKFTPANDVMGGTNITDYRLGAAVNAQNGNVCAIHSEMLGEHGWEFYEQVGAP